MAGLRKGHCYTGLQRAYTRKSKFKGKGFIKAIPTSKVVRYHMGDVQRRFSHRVDLVCKEAVQIRHNALESSRQVVNRRLNVVLGNNYHFQVRVYPHHVLRENKMITGAGADRMQTGMQLAFGRAVGVAARVFERQPVFSVKVSVEHVGVAKGALLRACARLPGKFSVAVSRV